MKIKWMYVGALGQKSISKDFLTVIEKDLELEFLQVNCIAQLFPLLSSPAFSADYISIDVEDLNNFVDGNINVDEYALLNTINTLINSTLYRSDTGKTTKRVTKLGITIGDKFDITFLKNILSIHEVDFISLRPSITSKYNIVDVEDSINSIIQENRKMSKKVQCLVTAAKQDISKNKNKEITITNRQQQILNLITQRAASNKIIARTLGITESTVKLHMSALMKKYGVRNRTQLAIFAKDQSCS